MSALIYVDVIEEQPQTLDQFAWDHRGEDADVIKEMYLKYRRHEFQPWRVLIKSGDNQEPLFRSTERYFNEADAIHAAELVGGTASNVYLRRAEHGNRALRLAQDYRP